MKILAMYAILPMELRIISVKAGCWLSDSHEVCGIRFRSGTRIITLHVV